MPTSEISDPLVRILYLLVLGVGAVFIVLFIVRKVSQGLLANRKTLPDPEVVPEKPSVAATAKPSVVTPAKPSVTATAKPSVVTPEKPSVAATAKPSAAMPEKPSTQTQTRPIAAVSSTVNFEHIAAISAAIHQYRARSY